MVVKLYIHQYLTKQKKLELSENLTTAPLQSFFSGARKTMNINNPKQNLVSVDGLTKFDQIMYIHSQTIERKLISDIIQRL